MSEQPTSPARSAALKGLRGWILGICFLAFLFRLWIISHGVTVSPDGKEYLGIAENLKRHGCFSSSKPDAAACEPTWGQQPPAYPFFLTVVTAIAGSSPSIIALVQCGLYCLALWHLLWRASGLGIRTPYLICSGLLPALSPNTAGWSSWVLTETLSGAACLWLLAECIHSIASRRISVLRCAAAIAACALLRWDMVWVAVPFIVTAFAVYPARKALYTVAVVGLLSVTPYVAWSARAGMVGLPLFPPNLPPIDEVPPGVQSFWKATAVKPESAALMIWPAWNRTYGQIGKEIQLDGFVEPRDQHRAETYIQALAAIPDGEPVPPELDRSMEEAAQSYRSEGLLYRARVILLRTYLLWFDSDGLNGGGYLAGESTLARAADVCRPLVLVIGLCGVFRKKWNSLSALMAGLVAMNVFRSVFLASLTAIEIRYLSACLPALEFAAIALWGLKAQAARAEVNVPA